MTARPLLLAEAGGTTRCPPPLPAAEAGDYRNDPLLAAARTLLAAESGEMARCHRWTADGRRRTAEAGDFSNDPLPAAAGPLLAGSGRIQK